MQNEKGMQVEIATKVKAMWPNMKGIYQEKAQSIACILGIKPAEVRGVFKKPKPYFMSDADKQAIRELYRASEAETERERIGLIAVKMRRSVTTIRNLVHEREIYHTGNKSADN
jgi:hypothetical protein